MHGNDQTLSRIKKILGQGGATSRWFAEAYVSWYRENSRARIDLSGVESLDRSNFLLFLDMLTLRRREGWSDQRLYEVEQYAISTLKTFK